jgi:hypothetical protein
MSRNEELERLSLLLIGVAVGFLLGSITVALGFPEWLHALAAPAILVIAFVFKWRSL